MRDPIYRSFQHLAKCANAKIFFVHDLPVGTKMSAICHPIFHVGFNRMQIKRFPKSAKKMNLLYGMVVQDE